ncbi:MAG: hypothetical protein R3D97_04115 [Paracoccaceae bacterium]
MAQLRPSDALYGSQAPAPFERSIGGTKAPARRDGQALAPAPAARIGADVQVGSGSNPAEVHTSE